MTPGDLKYFSAMVANLEVRDGMMKCLCCDRFFKVTRTAETSGYYTHFMSKKHAADREQFPDDIADLIKPRIRSQALKNHRNEKIEARNAEIAAAKTAEAEALRRSSLHLVSGEMLDEIVDEMHSLMAMMEPYYKQADADRDALALVARIKALPYTRAHELLGRSAFLQPIRAGQAS